MTIIIPNNPTLVVSKSGSSVSVREERSDLVVSQSNDTLTIASDQTETLFVSSPGPQGPPGEIGQVQFNVLATPGQTVIVDSLPASLVDTVKWILSARDSVNDLRRSMEITANHSAGSASHSVAYILGKSQLLNIADIDVEIQSGNLNLSITNNYTETLTISVARIKIDTVNL